MTEDSPVRSRYLRACCQCLAATDLRLGTFRRGPWALNELRRSLAGVSIDREWVAARVGITERTLPNQGRIGNARESAGRFALRVSPNSCAPARAIIPSASMIRASATPGEYAACGGRFVKPGERASSQRREVCFKA